MRAIRWVRDENFGRGAAPAIADVAAKFTQAMETFDQGSHTEALMRAASSASRDRQRTLRQWARRFRRRWGATNTNLSTLDAPPRAALGAKAGGTNKPPKLAPRFLESTAGAVQILDSRGLKSNPYYGLVFGPRFLESRAGAVQILDSRGPKSGPYYGLVFGTVPGLP